MKKICFCASSGGHFEQLMMLEDLMRENESYLVTEKTAYSIGDVREKGIIRSYKLPAVNRLAALWPLSFLVNIFLSFLVNIFLSLFITIRLRPKLVVCTGVLAMIPFCLFSKALGARLIYIESFAKVTEPTLTGRFLYPFADRFYVQWETMLKCYPRAIYLGGLY